MTQVCEVTINQPQDDYVTEPTRHELRRAYALAKWAGHAWATYLDPVAVDAISTWYPIYWPEEIRRATLNELVERADYEGKEEYFLAKRTSPTICDPWWGHGVCWRGVQVNIGQHDQLGAIFARGLDTFCYTPRRRVGCVLQVWRGEDGEAERVTFTIWRGTRGRDIARVVAAALASDGSDHLKSLLRAELEKIFSTRPAGAAEFASRMLDMRDVSKLLARK